MNEIKVIAIVIFLVIFGAAVLQGEVLKDVILFNDFISIWSNLQDLPCLRVAHFIIFNQQALFY